MASKEQRRAALQHTLQQLRDVTNSTAMNKASIIVEASKYIEELKKKVEGLNSELGISESSATTQIDELPMVIVKTLKTGFLINVLLEKNCPGILVSILEAFEELGLDVLDARVSCEDSFQLEAVGREFGYVGSQTHSHKKDSVDVQVVKQAVLRAIKNRD